jgi:DNA polymerase alpha subunit B
LEKPHDRIHCVSNPCTLQLDGVMVGVTATDVIRHLCAQEINENLVPGSRLTRVAQHVLQQQSYHPLFPAAVPVNMEQAAHVRLPCTPDVLLLPSKLTALAQTMPTAESFATLVVNPGYLTRETTGGTYAVVEISAPPAGDSDHVPPCAAQRASVQIRKI